MGFDQIPKSTHWQCTKCKRFFERRNQGERCSKCGGFLVLKKKRNRSGERAWKWTHKDQERLRNARKNNGLAPNSEREDAGEDELPTTD